MNFLRKIKYNEFWYFIKWNLNIDNLSITIRWYYKKILNKFLKKRYDINKYPEYLLNYKNNFKKINFQLHQNYKELKINLIKNKNYQSNKFNWNILFTDPEDTEALHRFLWIFLKKKISTRDTIKYIYSWNVNCITKSNITNHKYLPLESYTVSERLVNLILYFISNSIKMPDFLEKSLKLQAQILITKLEFFNKSTNNHILNNARALIIFGYFFNDNFYSSIGEKIIIHEIDKFIDKDGFLREGSSHYQFIITRWIFEIYNFTTNIKLRRILKKKIPKLFDKCFFFLTKKKNILSLTLFGDVSPDISPNNIIKIIYNYFLTYKKNKKINFANLFYSLKYDTKILDVNNLYLKKYKKNHIKLYNKSGWLRAKYESHLLFQRLLNQTISNHPSHEHTDNGHFLYYYNNNLIFNDLGRINYQDLNGVSSKSHNSIRFDKLENTPFFYKKYPYEYNNSKSKIKIFRKKNKIIIANTFVGLKRLKSKYLWLRYFFLYQKKKFEIQDEYFNTNKNLLETYFHINTKKIIKNKNNIFFKVDNDSFSLNLGANDKKINYMNNCFSNEYGKTNNLKTLILKLILNGNVKIKYCFSKLNNN